MKKVKKFWKWKEKFNNTDYRLRTNINDLLKQEKVVKDIETPNKYYGINNFPWVIETEDEIVKSIFFNKKVFTPFADEGKFWNYEIDDVVKVIDKYLLQYTPKNYKKFEEDTLYVVLNDSFISIVGILAKSIN